jgi:hypothetical protein
VVAVASWLPVHATAGGLGCVGRVFCIGPQQASLFIKINRNEGQ